MVINRFTSSLSISAAACAAIFSAAAQAVAAPSFYASTDKWGYTGTGARYATAADAAAGTNAIATFNFDQRDGSFFVVNDRPSYWTNYNAILTAWFYSTTGAPYGGSDNPNNTSPSFMQLSDDNGNSDTSISGYWTDSNYDTFQVLVSGGPSAPGNNPGGDGGRLWNGSNATGGIFHTYESSLTAAGLVGTDADNDGFYESNNFPSSVSGYFRGVFENTSTSSPAANGFYSFDLTFNDTSWAYTNRASLQETYVSEFGGTLVPEPTSLGLLGVGGLAMLSRRRRSA